MRQASGTDAGAGFALKEGLRLHVMADGSGVLADPASGEAHALNAQAVALLEAGDAAELQDDEAAQTTRFMEQLRALGLIEAGDD